MTRRTRTRLGYSTNSKTDLKAHVKACGSHFFDRDTMRFFNSKLEKVIPGKGRSCFVTSERYDDTTPRLYTVKKIVGCKIDTVGKFQQYGTKATAMSVARTCAGGGLSGARRRRR